jgi:transposase-like protein
MRLSCSISYRDLEEMMTERGITVDHTTLYRWVQRYAPELEKRALWYQNRLSFSWREDETYIKVRGKWKYLFRAIDKAGRTLDFYLSATRNAKAAKRFLAKALKRSKHDRPGKINTDKNPAYGEAIRELKKEGLLAADCHHRQMSSQLSAQAITAQIAMTRMSISRCSTLPVQRGSSRSENCSISWSINVRPLHRKIKKHLTPLG